MATPKGWRKKYNFTENVWIGKKFKIEILERPIGYPTSVHIYYIKSGRRKIYKKFKTKKEALKFAHNWMENHSKG